MSYGYLWHEDRESKRLKKVNLLMSNFIKTKTSLQCRSHHQKMMQRYQSIDGIIWGLLKDFCGETIPQTTFKQKVEAPKNELGSLNT